MFTKKLRKNQNKMFSFCTQNVLRIFKTLRCLPMAKHHFLESGPLDAGRKPHLPRLSGQMFVGLARQ